MDNCFKESFDRSCRLCAEEQDVTLKIFSEEAEAMLLQNKLNKYLLIEVDQDDKLPKNICIQCCSKLQTVCDFIDQAQRAQDMLLNRSMELDEIMMQECVLSQDIKLEQESVEDSNPLLDIEPCISPMEISVDPMIVLQNSEPDCIELEDQISNEDVSHLHGLDGENVTIKLIKRVQALDDEVENKPYFCTLCKRNFNSELALQSHQWIHGTVILNSKDYICNTCSEGFDYKCELVEHMKTHVQLESCKICSRVFRSKSSLDAHMTVHDVPKQAHTCKVCGQSYNTKSILKTHSITHSTERPYVCHVCKKAFKRNQDLKFHLNQHTGDKPYKCPFCDKCFASSGNCYSHKNRMHPEYHAEIKLKKWISIPTNINQNLPPHLRASQGIKIPVVSINGVLKYKCPVCNHSFVKKENCLCHVYQHTGEKPFKCSFCPAKFVTRRSLLIHHDLKHPLDDRPLALLSKNVLLK